MPEAANAETALNYDEAAKLLQTDFQRLTSRFLVDSWLNATRIAEYLMDMTISEDAAWQWALDWIDEDYNAPYKDPFSY